MKTGVDALTMTESERELLIMVAEMARSLARLTLLMTPADVALLDQLTIRVKREADGIEVSE